VAPYVPTAASQQQQQAPDGGSTSRGYQLLLRKYPIKTPAKKLLVLPTRSLALAIAAEWEWLPKGKPVPHLMPLMSLAATAIDQPKERSKVGSLDS
jgi:ATP synthase F1 complex assembly factor 2